MLQKGYRVYIEYYQCVIKDKRRRNQLIEKVTMIRNRLFPLRKVIDMKGKTHTRALFKVKSNETIIHCDKKENVSVEIQATFQT